MGKWCGDPKCGASTNIAGDASFGSGELDDFGFWEKPCSVCARAWEKLYPEEKAWPYSKNPKNTKAGKEIAKEVM